MRSRFLSISLSLAIVFSANAQASWFHRHTPVQINWREGAHAAEHFIDSATPVGSAGCTAYAIGPHALLTAQHCDASIDEATGAPNNQPIHFYVDAKGRPKFDSNVPTPYAITGKMLDGSDHMILIVSGPAFTDFLKYDVAAPVRGEHVIIWGNPRGIRDQYREGTVSGSIPEMDVPYQTTTQLCWLVDMNTHPGDSGSPVLDAKDGHLIGIVTYGIEGGRFAGIFELHFTTQQIASALAQ